jgi:hypothetical protein
MASASVARVAAACSSGPGKEIKEGLLLITSFDNAIKAKDSECGLRRFVPWHLQCLRG